MGGDAQTENLFRGFSGQTAETQPNCHTHTEADCQKTASPAQPAITAGRTAIAGEGAADSQS